MGKFGEFLKFIGRGIKKGATKMWNMGKNAFKKAGELIRPAADMASKIRDGLNVLPSKADQVRKLINTGGETIKGLTDLLPESQAKKKINEAIDRGIDTGQRYLNQGVEHLNNFNQMAQPWINSGIDISRKIANRTDDIERRMIPNQLGRFYPVVKGLR